MKILETIREGIRSKMISFLKLSPAQNVQIQITEGMDEETKVIKNKIWYRGDTYELAQLYSQLPNKEDTFWGAVQSANLKIRKIHTGLPALIVDVLTGIVIDDYNGIEFVDDNKQIETEWEEIEKDNKFNELLKESIALALSQGAGAFKVSFDDTISKYPILEFFEKERIEVVKKRKRVREIIFKTNFNENKKQYTLRERYGYGYIIYELHDCESKKIVPLDTTKETKGLENLKFANAEIDKDGNIVKNGDFMLACLFKVKNDAIYDKKTDDFDALDEAWSQWMNALRDGRSKTYVPQGLIPRNPKTGELSRQANPFDDKFIAVEDNASEDGKNQIQVVQPSIPTDSYMNTYITALDLALQGLISPSTLGIDTKKITDPNSAAQREKEKITLNTRKEIVEAVTNVLPELVNITFKAMDTQNKQSNVRDVECSVKFGEYANPSFEAQVETVGKGKTQGIMSIEASVDELYGDSKDDEWKAKEVARLKAEQGIVEMGEEPSVGKDGFINENESINSESHVSDDSIESTESITEKSKKLQVTNK